MYNVIRWNYLSTFTLQLLFFWSWTPAYLLEVRALCFASNRDDAGTSMLNSKYILINYYYFTVLMDGRGNARLQDLVRLTTTSVVKITNIVLNFRFQNLKNYKIPLDKLLLNLYTYIANESSGQNYIPTAVRMFEDYFFSWTGEIEKENKILIN